MIRYLLYILALGVIGYSTPCNAQKLELSFGANTGLANFTGKQASANSAFYYPDNNNLADHPRTLLVNPYGSRNTVSFDAYIQMQYILKSQFITGFQAGYGNFRTRSNITGYYSQYLDTDVFSIPNFVYIPPPYSATGSATVTSRFININPYIGYRISKRPLSIDLNLGVNMALGIDRAEKLITSRPGYQGNVETNGIDYAASQSDYRAKAGLLLRYKKTGISFSYEHGLKQNKQTEIDEKRYQLLSNNNFISPYGYSQLIKVGINYTIN